MSLLLLGTRGMRRSSDPLLQFLPPGMTLFCDTTLGNITDSAFNSSGLRRNYDARTITVSDAPWGSDVFEIFYAEGSLGCGSTGGWLYTPAGLGASRLYIGLSAWLSPNYVHWREKFLYPIVTAPGYPTQSSYLSLTEEHSGDTITGPLVGFNLVNQRYEAATLVRAPVDAPNAARWTKGQWDTITVVMQMNTVGNADGVCEVRVNGNVALSLSDVSYSTTPAPATFDQVRLTGTRGGTCAPIAVPAGGQVRRYNRLALYFGGIVT